MPQITKKKKKRFSIAYSRKTHVIREYGGNPYKPHFLDIFYATRGRPDKETLERVHVDKRGRYSYEPSIRYKALVRLERIKMNRQMIRVNEGTS